MPLCMPRQRPPVIKLCNQWLQKMTLTRIKVYFDSQFKTFFCLWWVGPGFGSLVKHNIMMGNTWCKKFFIIHWGWNVFQQARVVKPCSPSGDAARRCCGKFQRQGLQGRSGSLEEGHGQLSGSCIPLACLNDVNSLCHMLSLLEQSTSAMLPPQTWLKLSEIMKNKIFFF